MGKQGRFVITGQGRCGSNLLKFALMKHPEILMTGEFYNIRVFPESATTDGYERAKSFFERDRPGKNTVGFKIFAHHAIQGPAKSAWRYLDENDVSIIHLVRENRVERLISLEVAKISQAWTNVPELSELHDSIRLKHPPKWWQDAIRSDIAIDESLTEKFCNHKYYRVSYEHLVENWDKNIAEIEKFLAVSETSLPMTLKKQEKIPKSVRCENYSELWSSFKNTEYGWMFDEPRERSLTEKLNQALAGIFK